MKRTGNPSRPWIIGGLLLCVVMAAVTWFFFAGPQLDAQSATEQQVSDAQLQNSVLQQRINALRKDSEHVGELQKQLASERAGLPADHQIDAFTEQLSHQAAKAGVVLTSITPGQPTLVPMAAAAGAGTAGAGTASSGGAGAAGSNGSGPIGSAKSVATSANAAASSEAAAPANPTNAANATEAPAAPAAGNAAAGPAGQIYSIAVNVMGDGTMSSQRALLGMIEKQGPRRALVTSATFAPATGATTGPPTAAGPTTPDTHWTMTATMLVFVSPQSPDQQSALSAEIKAGG